MTDPFQGVSIITDCHKTVLGSKFVKAIFCDFVLAIVDAVQ